MKVIICSHQAGSPRYVWPDVWSGDLLVQKSMVVHDTECPYWDQVSFTNTNPTLILVHTRSHVHLWSGKIHCMPWRTNFCHHCLCRQRTTTITVTVLLESCFACCLSSKLDSSGPDALALFICSVPLYSHRQLVYAHCPSSKQHPEQKMWWWLYYFWLMMPLWHGIVFSKFTSVMYTTQSHNVII